MSDPDPAERPGTDWPRVGRFSYRIAENRWEWSDEVAQMHGYAPGTVTPTTELILSHKHPDDKPTVAELIDQVRKHGVPFSSRHRILDTAGKIHVVVVVGDRSYGPGGKVIGTSGFYVDVTDDFDADIQHSLDEVVAGIAESRAVINQAMGIIMLTHGVSADDAFKVLTRQSQQTNVKLRTVAARFVAAATASKILPQDIRDAVDHLLLTAPQEHPAG